jgi:hypothetical protein
MLALLMVRTRAQITSLWDQGAPSTTFVESDVVTESDAQKCLQLFMDDMNQYCPVIAQSAADLDLLRQQHPELLLAMFGVTSDTIIPTRQAELTGRAYSTVANMAITRTSLSLQSTNRFPVYGVDDAVLFERKHGPKTSNYLSMMVDTHPNLFTLLGPNAGVGAGNLLMIIERLVDYCAKMLSEMQTENIVSVRPLKTKVDEFTRHTDAYFERTVYSEDCSSWYKTDGRVTALWPGSSLHAIKVLENPRWEDFEYTFVDGNPMGWLGKGSTLADNDRKADKSYYLTSATLLSEEFPRHANGAA